MRTLSQQSIQTSTASLLFCRAFGKNLNDTRRSLILYCTGVSLENVPCKIDGERNGVQIYRMAYQQTVLEYLILMTLSQLLSVFGMNCDENQFKCNNEEKCYELSQVGIDVTVAVIVVVAVADPGFPVGGRGPRRQGCGLPRRLCFENFVCQNERIGTLGGGARRARPP